jgi:flagellar biogenesis protein FliO
VGGPLGQTKPDPIAAPHNSGADHPLDSPLTAVGDAWKMLAYLLPMLLLIVGSLHLLRRFQQRMGRLPAPIQAATRHSGKVQNSSRQPAGTATGGVLGLLASRRQPARPAQHHGAIRLVETVPIGGTNLHLVEVHGRMLLLGAAGGSVSLLTEFEEQAGIKDDDFRVLLRAAAADMDVLDLSEPDLPATTMMTALEEMMQETGEAVTRRIRRLRTVSDYETGEDVHA